MIRQLTRGLLLTSLLVSRVYLQPSHSLISDCDETYNYWEPLNLLVRGFGKQTWEYSPEYGIRSWALLLPIKTILSPINKWIVDNGYPSYWNFYAVRGLLGFMSTCFEWILFRQLNRSLNFEIAASWLIFQIFQPGWFHASVELLPSSIAMLMLLLSWKYALHYLSTGSKKAFLSSLLINLVAGVLGWPFVLILSTPLVMHYITRHSILSSLRTCIDFSLISMIVCGIVTAIDSWFYGKFTIVALNTVLYNVLNSSDKTGPNIFGTEPWSYYIVNLALNFPLLVLFASVVGLFHLSLWPLWSSLIIWLSIFLNQPHKEERFLYPVYSLITLSASVGLYKILLLFQRKKVSKFILKLTFFCLTAIQASSRILALISNYNGPIEIYSQLTELDDMRSVDDKGFINICTGREWYHFPTSFFLPDNYRLKYVASGFDGLLPGDFPETGSLLDKIRKTPSGMNNKNEYDPNKITDIFECDYFVEVNGSNFSDQDAFDPRNLDESALPWQPLVCSEIVDTQKSKILGRVFYIPSLIAKKLSGALPNYWRKYYELRKNEYCLYGRLKGGLGSVPQ